MCVEFAESEIIALKTPAEIKNLPLRLVDVRWETIDTYFSIQKGKKKDLKLVRITEAS